MPRPFARESWSCFAVGAALFIGALCGPAAEARAQQLVAPVSDNVHGLPLVELRAKGKSETLAIVLSGDGGWADIDKQIGKELAERGIDVVGFDDHEYLMKGRRDANSTASDVERVASHFMRAWNDDRLVIVGYSRGAAFAPFVATRLSADVRSHLSLIAMLGLPEHVSFVAHFSDLWTTRTNPSDTPILPELERLRGTNMLCVYGTKEDESLCKSVDSTLVFPVSREGAHHFDGDYKSITTLILDRIGAKGR
ncbi:MAG: AcvB/VirJ family lysyl-phosphatidylglycerol hydrolase [Gemmatimonadaceae bacterium]